MQWFWRNTPGTVEAAELKQRFGTLELLLNDEKESAAVSGRLWVADEIAFTVALEIPSDYPMGVPVLRCNPTEIPWKADRHVNEHSGEACLCVRSEYRIHWPFGSTLTVFVERLVVPYFTGQLYYDVHGCWPPTGHRSHGAPGIIEAYSELTAGLGGASLPTIERLMKLLARKTDPKGHELCPCGSLKKMRDCHRDVVKNLRRIIAPKDAHADLLTCLKEGVLRARRD